MMMSIPSVDEILYYGVCCLFLGACFLPMVFPLIAVGAVYFGFWWCRAFLMLVVLDYLVPLTPGPSGYWHGFDQFWRIPAGDRFYHDAEVIVEGDYTGMRNKNYCVASFPHGLYGFAVFLLRDHFQHQCGAHLFFAGADVIFRTPILRRLMTWWGCTKVSYEEVTNCLELPYPNNITMLMPDGVAGMFYSSQEHEQILLDRRRGFCRVALQTGASLVPTYVMGANQMYHLKVGPDSVAAKLSSKLRVSFVYWTGRWDVPFGFIPYKTKLIVVCGPPIDCVKTRNPTPEEIESLHDKFIQEIKGVYDRHKHRMGDQWAQRHDRLYLETEHPSKRSNKLD